MALGIRLYEITSGFPSHESYGLTSQIRRGAVSVASNVAEGYGRGTQKDYLRFLRVARGSLFEIETQVELAHRLGYIGEEILSSINTDIVDTLRVLSGLVKQVQSSERI